MHKLRLILVSLAFLAYSLSFGIIWLENIRLQLIALGVTALLCLIRIGLHRTLKQLKIIAPFIITMILVYGLLILFRVSPEKARAWDYWFHYGSVRMLLLISTLLAFRFCASLLSYQGLLLASGNIHLRKYLILGKILYQATFESLPRIRYWQSLIPAAQEPERGIKHRFNRALALSLALTLFTLEEARIKGEQIDNRINICHKEVK